MPSFLIFRLIFCICEQVLGEWSCMCYLGPKIVISIIKAQAGKANTCCVENYPVSQVTLFKVAGMAEQLKITCLKRVLGTGSKPPSSFIQSDHLSQRICRVSVIQGENAKGIISVVTLRGWTRVALLHWYFFPVGPFCASHLDQYLMKIVGVFAYQHYQQQRCVVTLRGRTRLTLLDYKQFL